MAMMNERKSTDCLFRSPEKECPVNTDIHSEISERARKLAQLEMVDRETSPILLTPEGSPNLVIKV